MKYEAPEMKALVPAINAIQTSQVNKNTTGPLDSIPQNDVNPGYADWED